MSYKYLVVFFNKNIDCINIVMQFLNPDPYRKQFNLNIRQIKYNNIICEINIYFFIKKLYSIYSTKSSIKLILNESNRLRDFNNLKKLQ